jgi:spore maturation protein CgeB
MYLDRGWAENAWTWHEAADTRVFHPIEDVPRQGDLVWIGNWGDEERTEEMKEFLLEPVRELGLKSRAYGGGYPKHAMPLLRDAGVDYAGWLANFHVPEVIAQYKATVHIPRRPYATALPGIPTIRVFEALSCGIPLVSAPWEDAEHLFTPGKDFLVARNGLEMTKLLRLILNEPDAARVLALHGLRTIHSRHTCRHRVDELMSIYNSYAKEKLRGSEARPGSTKLRLV